MSQEVLDQLRERIRGLKLEAWKLIKPSFLEELEGYSPEPIAWLLRHTTHGTNVTTVDARIRILCRRTQIKWKALEAERRKSHPNFGRF